MENKVRRRQKAEGGQENALNPKVRVPQHPVGLLYATRTRPAPPGAAKTHARHGGDLSRLEAYKTPLASMARGDQLTRFTRLAPFERIVRI